MNGPPKRPTGPSPATGKLVERSTRYLLLVHLPTDHSAPAVRNALVDTIKSLPPHLKWSLTWDQGSDLSAHPREDLDAVAAELNNRPRKMLGWETPAERLSKLLAA